MVLHSGWSLVFLAGVSTARLLGAHFCVFGAHTTYRGRTFLQPGSRKQPQAVVVEYGAVPPVE